jgi:hypothetical protein
VAGLAFLQGTRNGFTNLTFTSTLYDANIAFRRIVYSPLPLENGEDTIHIRVTDVPPPGSRGLALSTSNDISIWIQAVNTAPSITVPENFTGVVNQVVQLHGVAFYDPDITNPRLATPLGVTDSRVRVHVNVNGGGRLTLNSLAGLRFVSGSGWQFKEAVIEGSLTDVNFAFSTLRYFCTATYGCSEGDFDEQHSILFEIDDLGNIGPPGPHTASVTLPVEVLSDPYP